MKAPIVVMHAAALALLLGGAGCERGAESAGGVIQTHFPGQVTAGGGTSGQVLARSAGPKTDATYAGGQPGIAGGSGGNTGGAATGGSVQESGQGPSQGTTQPSSAGQPGATLPSGDNGKPAAPSPDQPAAGTAAHQDSSHSAAPGTLKGEQ